MNRLKKTWKEWIVFGGIERNPAFISIFVVTLIIQVVCIQTPMNLFFGCTYLGWEQWVICVAFGVGSLFWQFLINLMLVILDKFGCGHELPPKPSETGLFHGVHDEEMETKDGGGGGGAGGAEGKYAPSVDAAEEGSAPPALALKTPGEIGRDMAGGQQVDDWATMKGKSKLNAPPGTHAAFGKVVSPDKRMMSPSASPANSPRLTPRSQATANSGRGGNKVMPLA